MYRKDFLLLFVLENSYQWITRACSLRKQEYRARLCSSSTSPFLGLPHHYVLRISREGMILQPPKEVVYFLQLLIIQLSNKPRIPITTIPNINHPGILRGSHRKKIWESIPQRQFLAPSILPELHPVPKTNPEACFNFESLSTIFDCLPNLHSIPLSHLTRSTIVSGVSFFIISWLLYICGLILCQALDNNNISLSMPISFKCLILYHFN